MHGLINKAVESFLGDTYGIEKLHAILREAGLWDSIGQDGFDSLGAYPDAVTETLLATAVATLGRSRESLLEDLGTYLVSHPRTERLRRLMRFGGGTYCEFLRSLGDLPSRARLAVPDLHLPAMQLDLAERRETEGSPGQLRLVCRNCPTGFSLVMMGVLRAMGDDYGALVMLDAVPAPPRDGLGDPLQSAERDEAILISVHDMSFHKGREFALAAGGAGR